MSIAAISTSSYANYVHQSIQSQFKQFQQEFQKLGQDLQSGDVRSAQQDLSALQQLSPQGNSTSSAQKDFANIQQAFQNQTSPATQAAETHRAHHHHDGGGESASSDSTQTGSNLVRETSSTLRQYSPSSNFSAAQQAYTGFQNFQDFGATVPIQTSPLLIGPTVSFAA